MIEGIPKISVLIICYKQEELIKRAINSLLVQKDYIYEICVSDDCSPDRTWEVLQEYDRQYPGLFKLHRNEPNVGIFENVEHSWTMPTGDLVYQLSGDDECGIYWLKTVVNFIKNQQIDYKNELICIYGNYKCLYPNGDYFIKRNEMVNNTRFDLVSLQIRELIGRRGCCFSTELLNKFFRVSKGRSYVAEWAQEIQLQLFSDKSYYIDVVGNIYYTRIGVNVGFNKQIIEERVNNFPYMAECLEKVGYHLSIKDSFYIELQKTLYEQRSKWTFSNFWKSQLLKLKSVDFQYGFVVILRKSLKRKLFAFIRRIPHKNPFSMTI